MTRDTIVAFLDIGTNSIRITIITITIDRICRILTLEERRKIEGVSPERADIIISGALILQMILREDGIPTGKDSRKPGSMP
jgi:exopolyphosphatase/pppGpp-phosphohydrolase